MRFWRLLFGALLCSASVGCMEVPRARPAATTERGPCESEALGPPQGDANALVSRVLFVGNASEAAVRSGLAPQTGDVFDHSVLVDTAHAIERSWSDYGEAVPRVTVHARRATPETVDLCVRATALDPYRIDKAVDEVARVHLEEASIAQVHEYPDPALVAYVRETGARLASAIGPTVSDVTFVVTDAAEIDGFADAKARRVRISRGTLGVLGTEAQLAAVLAHELGHLSLRHGVVDDVTRAIGLKAGPERAESWEAYQQMQADRVAIDAVQRTGYDPHEVLTAIGSLMRFAFEEHATAATATYLFARLASIRHLLRDRHGGRIDRATYLARIDGLPFGSGRIQVRPAYEDGSLAEALAATCPKPSTELSLLNPSYDLGETITKGTPLKCLVRT